MLEKLKKEVFDSNIELVRNHLVTLTWGNASGYDPKSGLVVIKPSGVDYAKMKPGDMVVVDLEGNVVEGNFKPSSDTPTHLYIYKNFAGVKGIVHTHSKWATTFAQAGLSIKSYGTTHADHFFGKVPCTRVLTDDEIADNYELNTGKVIVETFQKASIAPLSVPAVLVNNHGPFTWGENVSKAVDNSVALEAVAEMAYRLILLDPEISSIKQTILDKHYYRKHGSNAYYGQKTGR
ncbi:L-ribulose-5-phosphate 4-epimerase [Lentisphaerota bacterium ZTH]|nr:L-ribulose-5-phosphate 4-epimerase [Lentisphaerota bacterium]WET05355.1 L-ribulose-5-phosphate 4-epimerase [Lentisphaerota bacterium ZTH]